MTEAIIMLQNGKKHSVICFVDIGKLVAET